MTSKAPANLFDWVFEKLKNLARYLWDLDARVKFNLIFFGVGFYAYIMLFETYGLLIAVMGLVGMSIMKMMAQYAYDVYERSKMTDMDKKSQHEQISKVSNRLEIIGLSLMIGLTIGSYFMHDDLLLQLKPLIDNCIIFIFLLTLRTKSDFFLGGAKSVSEKMLGSMVKYNNQVVKIEPKIWKYCDYLAICDALCGLGIDIFAFVLIREGAINEQEWFEFTNYYSKIPSAALVLIQFLLIMYGREQNKPKSEETASSQNYFTSWNPFNSLTKVTTAQNNLKPI